MQPCLEELAGRVRCGRYRVWENRETRSGRTLDLAFVVADALDPRAEDTSAATYFFGGPGSSVTAASPFVIEGSEELRQHRDLLFLDFRGVGSSGRLDCGVPYPRGVGSRFGTIFPLDHVVACRDRLAERAQLDLYTSAHNMDDLDELRAWLNYRTLDLNGGSYGTREIQVFLRRHPEAARTVILNAVAPIFEAGYVTHALGLQDALDELVAECLDDARCAAAYPDLATTVARVLERARTDPPAVVAEGETVRLGPGELGYALRGLLYRRAGEIPALVEAAAAGDWQPLADYYLQRSGWVGDGDGEAGMHFSVLCAEDIARVDPETIARETAGTFLGDYLIGGYARVCEVWPHARLDPSFWEPVTSDVPALLFSGTRDPVTPPSRAEAVARRLSSSLHLVVPGAGHGVGGPCIQEIQRRFVESASVAGLDTSCLGARPPTEFVIPEPAADPEGLERR
ncbi:MAG: alpha/beta hydrolase [Acidobacteriota bacterium]|nr:alpha/beta hydrolase [Acidobacteriota bacterium]MDH3524501.1 alpha/beta hydrolase [Acidobacteriota bacterium]